MSSSSPSRVLGTGLASLIPTDGASDIDPVAAATGRRVVAQLLQLDAVPVPVAAVNAAIELFGLMVDHPNLQAREAVDAVVERLRAAAGSSGAGDPSHRSLTGGGLSQRSLTARVRDPLPAEGFVKPLGWLMR